MTKQLSTHAATAKAIRNELKQAFPTVKFEVRSQSYAGGNSVHVEWTNGPTYENVTKLIGKYQYGHFDGMTDCYDITNSRDDIPQVKYVQASRNVSEDIKLVLFEHCKKHYNGWESLEGLDQSSNELKEKWGVWCARDHIYRMTRSKDLTNGLDLQAI